MILTYKFGDSPDEVYEYRCDPDIDDIIEYLLTEFVPEAHITPGCSRVIRDLYKTGIIERDLNAIYDDDEFVRWLTEYHRDDAYEEYQRVKEGKSEPKIEWTIFHLKNWA